MSSALIGYTGFVGDNIARQIMFDEFFNSHNIDDIRGRKFDLIVCAAAPGEKWRANRHPREDWATIARLLDCVHEVKAGRFVLISTVDVYAQPRGVNENTRCTTDSLCWYGVNRLALEQRIVSRYGDGATILRLPALFGPGLKKNAFYDLMASKRLSTIMPGSCYQWYSTDWLRDDIMATIGLPLVNLVSEPIEMREIVSRFFPDREIGCAKQPKARYDVETIYPAFRRGRDSVFGEMTRFLHENA